VDIIDEENETVNLRRLSYDAGEHARKSDAVYIVGMAATASLMPNPLPPDVEVWKINEAYRLDEYYRRVATATRWFQFHQRWDFTRRQNVDGAGKDHWAWLREEHPFPVYMQQRWDDIPSSVAFPLATILRDLLGDDPLTKHNFMWFRNSLSYQIAFAVWLGFKKVYIYGWELASDTEMKYERPSAVFWLGWLASAIGPDNIHVPIGNRLTAAGQRLYAFDDVPAINRMHIESAMNTARSGEYDAEVALRRDPSDETAKIVRSFHAGRRSAYERLMSELDDVSDPRGNFHEDAAEKEEDTSEVFESGVVTVSD
jgi:hypothetical protein